MRRACAACGVSLDEYGSGVGRTLDHPERTLAEYDVVFAKARCAIEALSAGCAVIAIDVAGYGGLVTATDVNWMLDWNVGNRCLQRSRDARVIEEDLRRIDADDVRRASEITRARCSLTAALDAYEGVYANALDGQRSSLSPSASPIHVGATGGVQDTPHDRRHGPDPAGSDRQGTTFEIGLAVGVDRRPELTGSAVTLTLRSAHTPSVTSTGTRTRFLPIRTRGYQPSRKR